MGRRDWVGLALALATTKLAVHVATLSGYGYFRDELYYLACARHLAWGYVDHPPLSVGVLAAVTAVLGDAREVFRLVPAFAGAATVFLVARLARVFGGGGVAMAFAGIGAIVAPIYLSLSHFYSMNALDVLFWAAIASVAAELLAAKDAFAQRDLRPWALLGVLLGLGLLNKASVLWLAGGLFVGIVATRHRRLLLVPGPWVALAIAALLLAPHVAWQVSHGFPTREFMQHATGEKMNKVSPLGYFLAQIGAMHPLTLPLWVPGLAALLGWRRLERFRPLGLAFVAIFVLLVANGAARTGYLAPAYPALLAAGGVVAEDVLRKRRWLTHAFAAVLGFTGAALVPLSVPCLPPLTYVRYAAALGQAPDTEEKKAVGRLPQFFCDAFGWPELTRVAAEVTATLTDEEHERAVLQANNYGEAAAFQHFGGGYLPPVVSGHNNYWLWGPGRADADVVIRLSNERDAPEWLGEQFRACEARATFHHDWVMPYENDLVFYVCRHPRVPYGERWPLRKHFD